MRTFWIALSLLAALLAWTPAAEAVSTRVCRRSCGGAVSASCDGLGHKSFKRCRHDLIRSCRREGKSVCATTTTVATTSTTTTTLDGPVQCGVDQKNCGAFCCNHADDVCVTTGEALCCAATFPVYCPDTGHGRFCCQSGFVCGSDGACQFP